MSSSVLLYIEVVKMNKIINEIKDLTFLEWSKIRESLGTAGSFLKSYMNYNNRKIYFKLSDYNKIDGIIGHECINEIIIDRLLSILGFNHLNYYLINVNIKIDEAIINTYLCASYDFKEKGESKIALDTFFELKRKEKIRRILIVWLHYLIMDFLFYARLEKNK